MNEAIISDWMPTAPLLLTKEQTAALLNVSVRTVGNLLGRRELVCRKIGSRTLVPRTSIEAFLKRDHATESEEQKEVRRQKAEQRRTKKAEQRRTVDDAAKL